MTFILRVIGRMFGDIEKENKAFVGEITELKKLITSLKDERDKLKKTLEESIVEKSQLVAREKNLIEENSKCNVKVLIKEDAHKVTVDKLKAEIEKLKGEISLQYKAGYDKALQVCSASSSAAGALFLCFWCGTMEFYNSFGSSFFLVTEGAAAVLFLFLARALSYCSYVSVAIVTVIFSHLVSAVVL
ncbi:hypothetical protein P8452_27883 [Trifolium repens]|nr:hypothetical protein P8452_27883 [Trifolium repens]